MIGINLALKGMPTVPGMSAFSPDQIPGLMQWLDGNDPGLFQGVEYLDGQFMAIWRDKSGNVNDVTQIDGAAQPHHKKNILNGKSVTRFGAPWSRTRWMGCAPFVSGSATLLATFKSNNAADWGGDFAKGGYALVSSDPINAFNEWWYFATVPGGEGASRLFRGDTLTSYPPAPIPHGIFTTWTFTSDATRYRIKIGNTTYAEQIANFAVGSDYRIGGIDEPAPWSKYFEGDIAEILVYSPAITYAQSDQVEQYLAEKWGL
jgi:hypothetical protein